MSDEIHNLILNVQGRDNVQQLRTAIAQEEEALVKAIAAHGQYSAAAKASAQTVQQLQADLKKNEALIQSTTTSTRNYQQASLAASFALQDFTSANGGLVQQLSSVNNNIPQIIAGLGGPVGLVAGLGALTTVVIVAGPKIYEYIKTLGVLGDKADETRNQVDRLKSKIKELEDKPLKITVDTVELDNLRRKLKEVQTAQQAFESFKGTKSDDEKQAGDETEQLISMAKGGAAALADRLAQSMGNQLVANDDKLRGFQEEAVKQTAKADEFARAAKASMNVGKPGVAAQQEDDARKATEAAAAASEAAKARRIEIQGDAVTGMRGEAHEQVGRIFQGATAGNNKGARDRLVAELNKIGEKRLADDIAGTNAHSVAAAKAEEQQEKNDSSMQETNNFIRGNRAKRAKLAKDEQKQLDEAAAEKARPVIAAYVKGMGLDDLATEGLGDLQKKGDLNPVQQFEHIQSTVKQLIEEELKSRGLLNDTTSKAAGATATTIAGQAQAKLEAEQARTDAAAGKHKPVGAVVRANAEEAASIKASGIDVMTEQLLAQTRAQGGAEDRFGRWRQMTPDQIEAYVQREVVKHLHRVIGVDRFGRPARANPGMDKETTDDLAMRITEQAKAGLAGDMLGFSGQGLTDQQANAAIAGGNPNAPKGKGKAAPKGGGGGFQSVPPTAPGEAKPAAAPQASGGGGTEDVVQSIEKMANVVQAGFAFTASQIKRIDNVTAQIVRGLQQQGSSIATLYQRAQQDNDTYLPSRF